MLFSVSPASSSLTNVQSLSDRIWFKNAVRKPRLKESDWDSTRERKHLKEYEPIPTWQKVELRNVPPIGKSPRRGRRNSWSKISRSRAIEISSKTSVIRSRSDARQVAEHHRFFRLAKGHSLYLWPKNQIWGKCLVRGCCWIYISRYIWVLGKR